MEAAPVLTTSPAALSAEGADSLLGEYTRVGDKLVGTIFFKGPITDEDREYLESLDVEIFYEFRGYDWAAARIPENVLPVLQNHPRIYGIELSTNAYLADCS